MIKDAPDIRMTEETGYPVPVKWPRCPVCGQECSSVYRNGDGEIVACDNCLEELDAWDWQEGQE